MALRRTQLLCLSAAAACALAGCSEDPSFKFRWRVAANATELADPPPLVNSRQCADVGISNVLAQVLVPDGGTRQGAPTGLVVWQRDYACFPLKFRDPDFLATGPSLDSGDYTLLLTGRGRNGTTWLADPSDPDSDALVVATADLVVGGGTRTVDAPLALLAPPQCQDGVDNDQDGLVDLGDPPCRKGDPLTASEDDDIAGSTFVLSTTFFGGNDAFSCVDAGIGVVRARVLDASDTAVLDETQVCSGNLVTFPLFGADLAAGEYSLELTAESPTGTVLTAPYTEAFTVDPEFGVVVRVEHDFSPDQFDPALTGTPNFALILPDALGGSRNCDPGTDNALQIDELTFQVLDGEGTPVDPNTFDVAEILVGVEGDQVARIQCTDLRIDAPDLTFGSFTLEASGWSGGVRCFETTEPVSLAPRQSPLFLSVPLSRISTDGQLPAGCEECSSDADCDPLTRCDANLCVLR